ncbi:MAG: TlpA family protein disulfide reductase [Acidiferrobacteraceae bacterium]
MPCRRGLILASAGAAALAAAVLLHRPAPVAPTLRLPLLRGGSVVIGRLQRSPTLLVFWSVTCTPCLRQLPLVIHAWRTLHALGLKVVAVDQAGDPSAVVRGFQRALPYPVALDPGGRAARAFDLRSIPRVILIGPHGHIRWDATGAFPVSVIARWVRKWHMSGAPEVRHALD